MNKIWNEQSFTKHLSEHAEGIVNALTNEYSPNKMYIWAPTGSGKTFMVNQIAETYKEYNVYLFEPTNSIKTQQENKSYKSSRLNILNWDAIRTTKFTKDDIIFIDEAHIITDIVKYRANVYKSIIDLFETDNKICLLSGTPYRETDLFGEAQYYRFRHKVEQQHINVQPINIGQHTFLSYVKSHIDEKMFILCHDIKSLSLIEAMAKQCGKTFYACRAYENEYYSYMNNKNSNIKLSTDTTDDYAKTAKLSAMNAENIERLIEYRDYVINNDFKDIVTKQQFDIIACTCYCEAGIDISWWDDRRIIVDGLFFGARDVIQFGARFRNQREITVDFVQNVEALKNNLVQPNTSTINLISDINLINEMFRPFDKKLKEVKEYGATVLDTIDETLTHQTRIKELEAKFGKMKIGKSTGTKHKDHKQHKEHTYKLTVDNEFGLAGSVFSKSEIIEMNKMYQINLKSMETNFAIWTKRNGFEKIS